MENVGLLILAVLIAEAVIWGFRYERGRRREQSAARARLAERFEKPRVRGI